MRGMFRNRTGHQRRNRDGSAAAADPYAPGSPGFAERTREREVELIGFHPGTVRIDVGSGAAAAPVVSPAVTPEVTPPEQPEPLAEPTPVTPRVHWRDDLEPEPFKAGLGKHTRYK